MTASLPPAYENGSYPSDDVPFTVQDRRRYGFFITDNELIDIYAPLIGAYAYLVYSALLRFANKDGVCFPSLNTLAERLKVSKPTVIKAIDTLIEHELIKKQHRFNDKGEHISNLYIILEVKQEPTREDEGGKSRLPGGSKADLPPSQRGSKRDLPKQNTLIINKTQQEEQDTQARRRRRKKQSTVSETNKAVVVALANLGMSNKVAYFLASKYSKERITEKIAYLEFMQDVAPDNIKNPCGWLRTAIVDDYARPDGFVPSEEREAVEAQEERREEEVTEQLRAAQAAQDERKREQETRRRRLSGQYGTTQEDFAFWDRATLEITYTTPAHIAALTADMDILKVTEDSVLVGVEREDVWRQLQHPNIQKAMNRALSDVLKRDMEMEIVEL